MARPRIIASPDEFDALVDAYLAACAQKEEPVTWTGMALYLGLSSRQSIDQYQEYEGFADSVKRAKSLVENAYEKRLHGNSPTGAIFALKNYGWRDKFEQEVSGPNGGPVEGKVVFEFVRPEHKG